MWQEGWPQQPAAPQLLPVAGMEERAHRCRPGVAETLTGCRRATSELWKLMFSNAGCAQS